MLLSCLHVIITSLSSLVSVATNNINTYNCYMYAVILWCYVQYTEQHYTYLIITNTKIPSGVGRLWVKLFLSYNGANSKKCWFFVLTWSFFADPLTYVRSMIYNFLSLNTEQVFRVEEFSSCQDYSLKHNIAPWIV